MGLHGLRAHESRRHTSACKAVGPLCRRSIYVLAVSLFALGSLLIVVAPVSAFWVILLGRAIGLQRAGGVFPVASAVIWRHLSA